MLDVYIPCRIQQQFVSFVMQWEVFVNSKYVGLCLFLFIVFIHLQSPAAAPHIEDVFKENPPVWEHSLLWAASRDGGQIEYVCFVLSRDPVLPENMVDNDAESIVKLSGQKIVAFILLWYFVPVGWMWKNVTYHSSELIHTL